MREEMLVGGGDGGGEGSRADEAAVAAEEQAAAAGSAEGSPRAGGDKSRDDDFAIAEAPLPLGGGAAPSFLSESAVPAVGASSEDGTGPTGDKSAEDDLLDEAGVPAEIEAAYDGLVVPAPQFVTIEDLREHLRDFVELAEEDKADEYVQRNEHLEVRTREWSGGLPSDGRYFGTWHGSRRHGWGVYAWNNGAEYRGEWQDDKPHGIGVFRWVAGGNTASMRGTPRGTGATPAALTGNGVYRGEWAEGMMCGWGSFEWDDDGRRFEGTWKDDMMDGVGTYHWRDGYYKGSFQQDKLSGDGLKVWNDGSWYAGQWKDSLKHGKGTYKWGRDGHTYDGDFYEDQMHGDGKVTWRYTHNGLVRTSSFQGQFRNDCKHGSGVFTWPDKTSFRGNWVQNQRQDGVFTLPDGTEYQDKAAMAAAGADGSMSGRKRFYK